MRPPGSWAPVEPSNKYWGIDNGFQMKSSPPQSKPVTATFVCTEVSKLSQPRPNTMVVIGWMWTLLFHTAAPSYVIVRIPHTLQTKCRYDLQRKTKYWKEIWVVVESLSLLRENNSSICNVMSTEKSFYATSNTVFLNFPFLLNTARLNSRHLHDTNQKKKHSRVDSRCRTDEIVVDFLLTENNLEK